MTNYQESMCGIGWRLQEDGILVAIFEEGMKEYNYNLIDRDNDF